MTQAHHDPRRHQAIAIARGCLGTRFRHQGRMPGVGLDCVGLLVHVLRQLGLSQYDYHHYGRLPFSGSLERHLMQAGLRPIDRQATRLADVLLFRFDGGPQHVALQSDLGMIHAFLLARQVVEHRIDEAWRRRLCGTYSLPWTD